MNCYRSAIRGLSSDFNNGTVISIYQRLPMPTAERSNHYFCSNDWLHGAFSRMHRMKLLQPLNTGSFPTSKSAECIGEQVTFSCPLNSPKRGPPSNLMRRPQSKGYYKFEWTYTYSQISPKRGMDTWILPTRSRLPGNAVRTFLMCNVNHHRCTCL